MPNSDLVKTLLEELKKIPLFDCHTHLHSAHLSARGLSDILLYHMVISDLYSAGCPDGSRVKEGQEEERIRQAIPFLKYIRNTSCYYGVKIILSDLYDFHDPITENNWEKLDRLIKEKSRDNYWPRYILNKSNIKRAMTEYAHRGDGSADDVLQYCFEETTFCRLAPNQPYDWPLLELERVGKIKIETISDIHKALKNFFSSIPYGEVLSYANHLSTDIVYRKVSKAEMSSALKRRGTDNFSIRERDICANYLLEQLLAELERHGREIVFQFSVGAEPFLSYETGSKLKQNTLFEIAGLCERFPRLRFNAFLSSEHCSQGFSTICREYPNISVSGYWWHNFFPSIIHKIISQRLDMIPMNKQIGFFSDAYCVEWAYAKSVIVLQELAEVLAEKIQSGQYTEKTAIEIAAHILYETPRSLLGMKEKD